MVRDFAIVGGGTRKWISDYRGRRSLVLVFTGEPQRPISRLLSELAAEAAELEFLEAQVVVIGRGAAHGFVSAAEDTPELRKRYGAEQGAVLVTDRYGEILYAARATQGEKLPQAREVLGWLEFALAQCPE